jgi:hypothetical protein
VNTYKISATICSFYDPNTIYNHERTWLKGHVPSMLEVGRIEAENTQLGRLKNS